MEEPRVPDIPGFYYDLQKKKYFRIQDRGFNASSSLYTHASIQKTADAAHVADEQILCQRKMTLSMRSSVKALHHHEIGDFQTFLAWMKTRGRNVKNKPRRTLLIQDCILKYPAEHTCVDNNLLWSYHPTSLSTGGYAVTSFSLGIPHKEEWRLVGSLTSAYKFIRMCRMGSRHLVTINEASDSATRLGYVINRLCDSTEGIYAEGGRAVLVESNLRPLPDLGWVTACTCRPSSNVLSVATDKHELYHVDCDTGAVLSRCHIKLSLSAVEYSWQSGVLHIGSKAGELLTIDTRERMRRCYSRMPDVMRISEGHITSIITSSNDGDVIVGLLSGGLAKFDVRMKRWSQSRPGMRNRCEYQPLKVSENGSYLCQALHDQTIRLWETKELELLQVITMRHSASISAGQDNSSAPICCEVTTHSAYPCVLALSPDGLSLFDCLQAN